eukprot:jgi/Galph1/3683/GphlegSOOS_G2367.1
MTEKEQVKVESVVKQEQLLQEDIDDIPLSELKTLIANEEKKPAKKPKERKTETSKEQTLSKICGETTIKKKKRETRNKENVEVKKFSLPGQRREAPPKNDPLRLFYESMYEEKKRKNVESMLVENWLLIHGLLEYSEAKTIYEKHRLLKGKPTKSEKSL